jgi:peptidoglycan/xylan/chitin deacetylase (PgdA/CDA1 family)
MKPQPILTFSFDDCYQKTVNSTLPLLVKYQMKAVYNFIAGLAGKELEGLKLASWEKIKKAERLEMEITSHSLTHRRLTTKGRLVKYCKSFLYKQNLLKHLIASWQKPQSPSKLLITKTVTEEIAKSQQLLKNHGIEAVSFVYPYGFYDNKIKEIVKNYYSSARSTDGGLNYLTSCDPYALKVFTWDKWTKTETANRWVEKAIKDKAWLIEVFHLIAKDNEINHEYFTSISSFQNHLEFIKNKKIWIATQKEIINYLNNEKR